MENRTIFVIWPSITALFTVFFLWHCMRSLFLASFHFTTGYSKSKLIVTNPELVYFTLFHFAIKGLQVCMEVGYGHIIFHITTSQIIICLVAGWAEFPKTRFRSHKTQANSIGWGTRSWVSIFQ